MDAPEPVSERRRRGALLLNINALHQLAGALLARELQEHVKRAIAPYKYPRAVEFLSELPKTPTGKLQRYVLRERASS